MKILGLLFVLYLFSACQQKKAKTLILSDEAGKTEQVAEFDLEDIAAIAMDTVKIAYDNYFKGPQTFIGTDFRKLLDQNAWRTYLQSAEASQYKVVFEATDGYRQQIPLQLLYQRQPVLTDQWHTINAWPDSLRESVLPYYLTWLEESPGNVLPYPWGVARIYLIKEKVAFPYSNLSHISGEGTYEAGYRLFNQKCRGCHSMNKEGGNLGPDLNYPQNITEYRTKSFIRDFIQDPQSFRYNSKMPAAALNEEEFEVLFRYLRAMAAYTIN